jgi:hypothetical protein
MRKHIVQKGKTFTTTAQTKQRHTTTAAQRIVTGIQRGKEAEEWTFHPATHPCNTIFTRHFIQLHILSFFFA